VPVTVPWSIIETVNGGQAFVTYHVEDSVTNHSLWAKSVEVDASTGSRLPMPTVVDTDDFGQLPIEVLNFGPVRVQVQYPTYASDDVVVLTFGGITRDGIALPDTSYSYTWPNPAPIRHTFEVPYDKALALVGGEIRTSYTAQAPGEPKATSSAIAVVEVTGTATNLPAPAVPEAVGGELDPAAPGLYVTVTVRTDYPFFQPTDRITLYWRGESLDGSTIVSDQQTQSGSDAVIDELRFSILRAKIVQVAGGKVTVSYEVLTPGNVTVPSDMLPLTVKAGDGSIGLPQPIVEGVSADDALDPADVGDTIVVHLPANASFLPGDTVQVVWRGVGLGGSFTTPAQAADTTGMRFDVGKSVLVPNAGQRVTVFYLLIRPGVDDRDSDKRHLTVLKDSSEGDLPAPTVTQAPTGTLDSIAAGNGATVVVPARADLETGDTVTATFGSYTTSPPQAAQPGMLFVIPAGEVARYLGTSISVVYTRWRNGTPLDSDVLPLKVLDLPDNDARVTKPVFVEAGGSFILDLNDFVGDAAVKVTAWPLMATGQRFWLRAIGGGNNWLIADGELVGVVGDLTDYLARNLLDTLTDNASLTLQLKVAFDGGTEATAKTFASLPYTVRVKVTPFYIDPSQVTLTGTQTLTRSASGGVPPYSYASSKPTVVKVPDASHGLIQGVTNGSAIITASDREGSSKTYPVNVTGNIPPFYIDPAPVSLTGTQSYTRNASGGVPPYTYVSSKPGVVKVNSANSGVITGVANGSATLSARDSAQGVKTYSVTVSGIRPFPEDITEFTNYDWNGWEREPAGSSAVAVIHLEQGNYRYRNGTLPGTNAGVILKKKYLLNAGKRYQITFSTVNLQPVITPLLRPPIISVRAGSVVVIGPKQVDPGPWITVSGTFVATTQNVVVTFVSHENDHNGNDYDIDIISVKQLD
jgi:hypothetical protein